MRRFFRRLRRGLLLIVLLLLVCFFTLRIQYRQIIQELAQVQVRNTTSDLTNDAIAEQISSGSIQYEKIVFFEKDLNGKITALKTNIGEINRLKTSILEMLNSRILSLDAAEIGIPIGSLFLPEFLSGKGPTIPVHILSIRNSEASFSSHFSQAGINQTLHQLIMEVSVDVAVLVLGESNAFTVSSQFVVAETVIVGDVPQTFIQTASAPNG